ncbi:MAG: membrane protein insertion efficiency factor YidD [Candidatus Omnitrophica bacterium]|nr:membrane protein insertion efficiency factor YidD [Candidatus Omnitrophota bacterium]
MKNIVIIGIKGYKKFISPLFKRNCRFYPSCSEYAIEAIEIDGLAKGSLKAVWRILKCNPFSRGGFDPVKKR